MPSEDTFAGGSTLLQPIADIVGLGCDKVNFVVALGLSLVISLQYRKHCGAHQVSKNVRLAIPLVVGIAFALFVYGQAFKHVVALVLVSYALLHITPYDHLHRSVFIFSLGYLTWIHLYRYLFVKEYLIDISGPMMIVVQKVQTLAFSVHDGCVKVPRKEKLTITQAREALTRIPPLLDYCSYMFSYMSLFCGPLCFYADYMAFIDGLDRPVSVWRRLENKRREANDIRSVSDSEDSATEEEIESERARPLPPVPDSVVYKKAREALIAAILNSAIAPLMPPAEVLYGDIGERSIFIWYPYLMLSLIFVRCQYYFAWLMSDAIHNAAGFGYDPRADIVDEKQESIFSEYDAKCERWSLVRNVRPIEFETTDSWKVLVDAWNISTLRWLRRVAYERLHVRLRTPATYFLSAWWHGFFPGYYTMFGTAALATSASRRVRRSIRHYFLDSPQKKYLYDCLTCATAHVFITYSAYPFLLMHFAPGIQFFNKTYWAGHILMLFAIVVLPRIFRQMRAHDLKPAAKVVEHKENSAAEKDSPTSESLLRSRSEPRRRPSSLDDNVSLGASSIGTMLEQNRLSRRYADDDNIPVAKIPKLVEKALKELPTADPLVSPRSKSYRKKHN